MIRLFALIVVVAIAGLPAGSPAAAATTAISRPPAHPSLQIADPTLEQAAQFAIELSRLEANRDWAALVALQHPDSMAQTSPGAITGWYESEYADKDPGVITVTDAVSEAWQWPVTGTTYDAVTVTYTQPIWTNGVRSEVPGVVHVVWDGEQWGWFFGGSREFVDDQLQRFAPAGVGGAVSDIIDPAAVSDPVRVEQFPDPLHAHVDAYWSAQFAAAGIAYTPPRGVIGFSDPVMTGCGLADPAIETAFYCVLDQTIYYSDAFRSTIETNIGDFGWVVVVAHEWGHHVQFELGIPLTAMSFQASSMLPAQVEQQADCLAGAYTESAELSGWLDPGDVQEALTMTRISGDPEGVWSGDGLPHGTGAEREAAFNLGFDNGFAACNLNL